LAELLFRTKVHCDKEGRITIPVEVRRRKKTSIYDLKSFDDDRIELTPDGRE